LLLSPLTRSRGGVQHLSHARGCLAIPPGRRGWTASKGTPMNLPTRVLVTLAIAATLAPSNARAAWPTDPDVNLPVSTGAADQRQPAMIADGAGGTIITWWDTRGGTPDIYAQRLDGAGVARWTAGGVVVCSAAKFQVNPVIVSDGVGGAIIVWDDNRKDPSYDLYDLYAQRLNSAGVPQWATNGVPLSPPNVHDQLQPCVVSDGAGGAIIAWQDKYYSGNANIEVQWVDATGARPWGGDGPYVCIAAADQGHPVMIADGAGGAFIGWEDMRAGNEDVYAQHIDATGAPSWTADGVAISAEIGDQAGPQMIGDGAGGVILVWTDSRSGNADVFAQRVSSEGVPQWTADGVPVCIQPNGQIKSVIAPDGSGGAIIAWADWRSGNSLEDYDVYAQRLDGAGEPQWALDGVPLCVEPKYQYPSGIISDGQGGAEIAVTDLRNGTDFDLYAIRVNAVGNPLWTANGVVITAAPGNQSDPVMVSDGDGGAIMAWPDYRTGTSYADLYAQNVNADGTLGGSTLAAPPRSPARFGLRNAGANPALGALTLEFTLVDDSPAILEIFDVTGAAVIGREVGELGPGTHQLSFTARAARLRPGVYGARLAQGQRRAFTKFAILR